MHKIAQINFILLRLGLGGTQRWTESTSFYILKIPNTMIDEGNSYPQWMIVCKPPLCGDQIKVKVKVNLYYFVYLQYSNISLLFLEFFLTVANVQSIFRKAFNYCC